MGSVTSNPKISVSLLPAAVVDSYADRRDIIFGQTGDSGTAVSGALNTDVQAMTTAAIKVLFGADTFLTNCVLEWKASNGSYSSLDVIGIDPSGTGTVANSTYTFVGTATEAGSFFVTLVDDQYKVEVVIASGDTAVVAATKLVAAHTALTDPVFSSDNGAGTLAIVTTSSTDKGTIGNDYGIKIEGAVAGLALNVTTSWVGTGTNDPVITSAIFDAIDGIRYTGAIWPEAWVSSLGLIQTEFESRFNASNTIMDGSVFHGSSNTYALLLSQATAINSKVINIVGNIRDAGSKHSGPRIMKPADWTACEFLGIRSRRLTTGAPIADYIISMAGGLDAFGGPSTASLPYFNTPIANTPVTASPELFTTTEQLALEAAGTTIYGPNSAQNAMIMAPCVTTWKTDAGGNDNVSFKYLNYVDTGSACREIFYSTLKSTYAQSRLTEGDLVPGRSMANAESIKAELLRIYKFLSTLALTQTGAEAESYFSTNTTVTITLADRLVTISGPLPIVTQVGTINYSLQLAFTVGGTGTQITV